MTTASTVDARLHADEDDRDHDECFRAREHEIERRGGKRGERRPFLDCVTAVLFRT
jgi:hypothetical protein